MAEILKLRKGLSFELHGRDGGMIETFALFHNSKRQFIKRAKTGTKIFATIFAIAIVERAVTIEWTLVRGKESKNWYRKWSNIYLPTLLLKDILQEISK